MAETKAIVGLILNIIGFVGVGSLIGGRTKAGIWQIVLWVLSIVFIFGGVFATVISPAFLVLPLLGWLVYLAAWVWALVTGIQMLKD